MSVHVTDWLKQLKHLIMPDQPPIGVQFPVVSMNTIAEKYLTWGSRQTGADSPTFEAFKSSTKLTSKWGHYFDIYDDCLVPIRDWLQRKGETPGILEIGTCFGGSLIAWRSFFGPKSVVCGLDVFPKVNEFEDPQIKMVIGSQTDENSLKAAISQLPRLHVVIDDGSHLGADQKVSFRYLWRFLEPGGLYIVEDLHTAYWRQYEKGILRRRRTGFTEYAKHLVDIQHAHYSSRRYEKSEIQDFCDTLFNVSFFDSVVVMRKSSLPSPRVRVSNQI